METIKNLARAFVGESQARNRYDIYASIARKERFDEVSEIFRQTAKHEGMHAKKLFSMIQDLKKDFDEPLDIETNVSSDFLNTKENLKSAIKGETFEHENMYPDFADVAKKEGFDAIANKLLAIAKAEEFHKKRFENVLENISGKDIWICEKCGYNHEGNEAPNICPSCDHSREYFYRGWSSFLN